MLWGHFYAEYVLQKDEKVAYLSIIKYSSDLLTDLSKIRYRLGTVAIFDDLF